MEQQMKRQLPVYLLGYIYIDSRRNGMEQKQMQRFIEFADTANILLCLPHWQQSRSLWTSLDSERSSCSPIHDLVKTTC